MVRLDRMRRKSESQWAWCQLDLPYLTQTFIAEEQTGETTTPPSHPLPDEFSEVPTAFGTWFFKYQLQQFLCSTLNLCADCWIICWCTRSILCWWIAQFSIWIKPKSPKVGCNFPNFPNFREIPHPLCFGGHFGNFFEVANGGQIPWIHFMVIQPGTLLEGKDAGIYRFAVMIFTMGGHWVMPYDFCTSIQGKFSIFLQTDRKTWQTWMKSIIRVRIQWTSQRRTQMWRRHRYLEQNQDSQRMITLIHP